MAAPKILVAGASGLIGTALQEELNQQGYEVHTLVRKAAQNNRQHLWNPGKEPLPAGFIDSFDGIINLAGATIAKPWTKSYIKLLFSSRMDTTSTLVNAVNAAKEKPGVLINASASGFYGNRGEEVLTEDMLPGTGTLAELCVQWEKTAAGVGKGTRPVMIRTGIVLSGEGGALAPLMPFAKLGIRMVMGNGQQWWPWITLEDHVRAIAHCLITTSINGPINFNSPHPARMKEIAQALPGPRFSIPLPAPRLALELAPGGFGKEVLLASQRMSSAKLVASGFKHHHGTLRQASEYLTAQRAAVKK